jgi:hypothetical protein
MMQRLFGVAWVILAGLWLAHCLAVFLYPLGNDPAIFQYYAWAMSVGEVPYVDSLDVNTPGIILLHWMWGSLLGYSDAAFLSLAVLLSTAAYWGALWVLRRSRPLALMVAAMVGLWAFVSITPWDRGQREIFQGFLLLLAVFAGSRERTLTAGLFLGAAVTIKASILLVIAPAGLFWLWRFRPGRQRFGSLVLGAAIPIGAVLIWLAAIGAWGDFWWTQWHYLPHHRSQFTVPWQEAISHPLAMWLASLGLIALFCSRFGQLMGVTMLSAVGLYLFQRHGWSYHLHSLVPLMLPVVSLVAERFVVTRTEQLLAWVVAVGLLFLIVLNIHYDHTKGLERAHRVDSHWDFDAHQKVAAFLREKGPESDRVLTNNDEQQLLYMARRRGATRCLYSFMCSEAETIPLFQKLSRERLEQLRARPPQWVVWNTHPYAKESDTLMANPRLAQWIAGHCQEGEPMAPYRVWRCNALTR